MADDLFVGVIAVDVVVVIRCIRAMLERFDVCHRGLVVSFCSHCVKKDNEEEYYKVLKISESRAGGSALS